MNQVSHCVESSASGRVALEAISDHELSGRIELLVARERKVTVVLLEHLGEFDRRQLYLPAGYSSLFAYCTERLGLSEAAAYRRITVARVARRYPSVLDRLRRGDLHLSAISLLAPVLRQENIERLLGAAERRGRREVEEIVARERARHSAHVKPALLDLARVNATPAGQESSDRPTPRSAPQDATDLDLFAAESGPDSSSGSRASQEECDGPVRCVTPELRRSDSRPPEVLRLAIDAELRTELDRARALLRHAVPDGDPAIIFGLALRALLERVEGRKWGRRRRRISSSGTPRRSEAQEASEFGGGSVRSRYIPAPVRRAVWLRDGGRCAFVGAAGHRCAARSLLEFHHRVPFARGGAHSVENLELRCAPHNRYQARLDGLGPTEGIDRRNSSRDELAGGGFARSPGR
ncbi:MAG: HNH endonuclease [Candidatus Eisenbacteria bacterium]|nr:HNH endonuclease [Candidatus Eisenbacteria bacterium]